VGTVHLARFQAFRRSNSQLLLAAEAVHPSDSHHHVHLRVLPPVPHAALLRPAARPTAEEGGLREFVRIVGRDQFRPARPYHRRRGS